MTRSTAYRFAISGRRARDEITKMLYGIGCSKIGFMDNIADHTLVLEFEHRGRRVSMHASAAGWATMHLKNSPYTSRMKKSRADYERDVLEQGQIAVNSILRDWVKGQVVAIETGLFSFEDAFLAHILLPSGETVATQLRQHKLLNAPGEGA